MAAPFSYLRAKMLADAMLAELPVRERPIIFTPESVRAILDGRKTQTRRVVADANSVGNYKASQLHLEGAWVDAAKLKAYLKPEVATACGFDPDEIVERLYCRWRDGERLWVKETHLHMPGEPYEIMYADHEDYDICRPAKGSKLDLGWRVRSAIHMPRTASRLTLSITDVRVERLEAITEADATAEGFTKWMDDGEDGEPGEVFTAVGQFMGAWQSINGPRGFGWGSNCWVWALTFRVV